MISWFTINLRLHGFADRSSQSLSKHIYACMINYIAIINQLMMFRLGSNVLSYPSKSL